MSHSPARTFNRRTFAKGVGWAAPAVVASAAVPAYAASICEVRTAPSFRQAGAWAFRNPESGVLKAPASNQPTTKFGSSTGFQTQPHWGPPLLLLKFQQVLRRALAVGLF